jgi:hypothetical protein
MSAHDPLWSFGSEIQLKRICDGAVLQVIGRLAHIVEIIFDLGLKSCRFVVSAGGSMVSRR